MAQDDGLDWFDHPEEFSEKEYTQMLRNEVQRLRREWNVRKDDTMSICNKVLQEAGKPNPRTCSKCGLGPCTEKFDPLVEPTKSPPIEDIYASLIFEAIHAYGDGLPETCKKTVEAVELLRSLWPDECGAYDKRMQDIIESRHRKQKG
jgi:hypothetical protein